MTKRDLVKLLTILAATGAIAGTAMATGGDWQARFDKLDVNGDGKVTQSEIDLQRAARYKEIDKNGDGVIDQGEYKSHVISKMEPRIEKRYQKMDSDNDGKVTVAEFQAQKHGRHFKRMDADGDGVISKEEAAKAAKKREMRKRH